MKSNERLHALIKLRHLKSASRNNWEILNNTQKSVNEIITEAKYVMTEYGEPEAKERFAKDSAELSTKVEAIQRSLSDFHKFIAGDTSLDLEISFQKFKDSLETTLKLFADFSGYPASFFTGNDNSDWIEIWNVIRSNMATIQGVGESAYIKSLMIRDLSNSEVDQLTSEIIKHIPESFNLLEADKYKTEYLQAVKEIEEESNAKDNLWDRFLNILAGAVPFMQTPEERVMMRRWLDGERGEL